MILINRSFHTPLIKIPYSIHSCRVKLVMRWWQLSSIAMKNAYKSYFTYNRHISIKCIQHSLKYFWWKCHSTCWKMHMHKSEIWWKIAPGFIFFFCLLWKQFLRSMHIYNDYDGMFAYRNDELMRWSVNPQNMKFIFASISENCLLNVCMQV